jgi:hypothetical protein
MPDYLVKWTSPSFELLVGDQVSVSVTPRKHWWQFWLSAKSQRVIYVVTAVTASGFTGKKTSE